jgi:nicotinamidase-related amidase
MTSANSRSEPVHRLLVCVDLQQSSIGKDACEASARTESCLANCRRLLRHARDADWSIVHSYRRSPASKLTSPPLPDFEPRLSEAVMPRTGISAFSNRSLRWLVEGARDAQLVLVGFCLGPTGLATLFSAHDLGLPTLIVRDAVCTEAIPGGSVRGLEAAVWDMAGSMASTLSTDRLIGRQPLLRVVSAS